VQANPVVGVPPAFSTRLHLPECIKQLPIQQFIGLLPVETLDIAVLPRGLPDLINNV
jgi:hypothetical protein